MSFKELIEELEVWLKRLKEKERTFQGYKDRVLKLEKELADVKNIIITSTPDDFK